PGTLGSRRAPQPPREQPQPYAIAQTNDREEEEAQKYRDKPEPYHGTDEPVKAYPVHQRFRPPSEQQRPAGGDHTQSHEERHEPSPGEGPQGLRERRCRGHERGGRGQQEEDQTLVS